MEERRQQCDSLNNDTQKELWKTAKDIANSFEDFNKNKQSANPIVNAILEDSEKRFKGNIKAEEKKILMHKFEAVKFGTIYSIKRMKYMGKYHCKSMEIWNLHYDAVVEELKQANL